MDPTQIVSSLPPLPTTPEGWIGWAAVAVVTGVAYLPKFFGERRGENKENARLEKALAEERTARKEAQAEARQANDRNNELIQRFSDQNALNARLEEQMKHLSEQMLHVTAQNEELRQQNDVLRKQVEHLQATIQGRQP